MSANALVDVRAMFRDLSDRLDSNAASTPVIAQQDRGIRDAYVRTAISLHSGHQEWKFGGDLVAGTVRERFEYQITDPDQFDPGTMPVFAFDGRRSDREQGAFVQDRIQWNHWTFNAGVRWDHYQLIVDRAAVSPRLSAAWAWPEHDLVVRASYDRAFQTPAVENLLLASSPAVDAVSDAVLRLPVQPSLGNLYEVGATKALAHLLRVDGSVLPGYVELRG
jgi:outer membrane receptor protein involved in Fe transport